MTRTEAPNTRVTHVARLKIPRGAEDPPPTTAEVAFVGRSNVGKSTLLNALVGRKRFVPTSGTPGCTRALDYLSVELGDGASFVFVDLPGYGYAKRSKAERASWAPRIERYLLERPALRVVVVLVDVRRGLEPDDLDLLEMLADEPRVPRPPLSVVIVATKLDKLPASERKLALGRIRADAKRAVVGFSSRDPSTTEAVWRRLRAAVDG